MRKLAFIYLILSCCAVLIAIGLGIAVEFFSYQLDSTDRFFLIVFAINGAIAQAVANIESLDG